MSRNQEPRAGKEFPCGAETYENAPYPWNPLLRRTPGHTHHRLIGRDRQNTKRPGAIGTTPVHVP